ncbi:MAG: CgeB family protein [Anaerolineae bacterium]
MEAKLKLLLAGDYDYPFYEPACAKALESLGVRVERFAWGRWFRNGSPGRLQAKYMVGPAVWHINRCLERMALQTRPDVVLVWRGNPVWARTLDSIKRHTGALLISHHNDDPLEQGRRYYWRHLLRAMPSYDMHLAYRHRNLREFVALGAREVHLMRSYYVPDLHHPITLSHEDHALYGAQAVFVGHYEPDGRWQHLRALLDAGVDLHVFGGNWPSPHALPELVRLPRHCVPIRPVVGEEYLKALCGAQLALNFLSRRNRDTYTRRCFEITACGRLLLSERTEDLLTLFREDVEAVYFSSPEELVTKARHLLAHPRHVASIAAAGMRRCVAEGHNVQSRMAGLVALIRTTLQSRRV